MQPNDPWREAYEERAERDRQEERVEIAYREARAKHYSERSIREEALIERYEETHGE